MRAAPPAREPGRGPLGGLARGWGAGVHERKACARLPGSLFETRKPRRLALVYVNPETAGEGRPESRYRGRRERRAQPSRAATTGARAGDPTPTRAPTPTRDPDAGPAPHAGPALQPRPRTPAGPPPPAPRGPGPT